jgi:5-formyltetrahydrofolate cyclo-ligase
MKREKRALRQRITRQLKQLAPEEIRRRSALVTRNLTSHPLWEQTHVVLCFLAMAYEINTDPIVAQALKDGKRVGVPRMHGDEIVFYEIESLHDEWEMHPYGVREPRSHLPACVHQKDGTRGYLLVTPGLAFDRCGRRLGRGKGYYDRFLRSAGPNLTPVGVAFAFQMLEEIPVTERDMPVQAVVTEDGWFDCAP